MNPEPGTVRLQTVVTAVGDLMFSGVVRERMEVAGDMAWSLRPVQEVLGRGDVLFGNFEFPVSVARRAEPGCKPERVSPPGIGRALRDAGFHVVNFAHNHLYDFGAEGVECTLDPGVEVDDLIEGVHAGIGAAGTDRFERHGGERADRRVDVILHRAAAGLALPAAVGAAAIGDAEGDSHDG